MSQQIQERQLVAAVARAMAPLPDKGQWVNRFEVGSRTDPNKNYVIAQNAEHRHWGCSCMGWRTRRYCKHLDALGLPVNEVAYELPALPEHGSTGNPVIDLAINNLATQANASRSVPRFVPGKTTVTTRRGPLGSTEKEIKTEVSAVKERRFLLD